MRSCIACAKAKTRCNGASPRCARCVTRNTECFPQVDKNTHESSTNSVNKESRIVRKAPGHEFQNSSSFEISQSAGVDTFLSESESGLVHLDFPGIGINDLDWDMLDMNIVTQDLEAQPLYSELPATSSPTPIGQSNGSTSPADPMRSTIFTQSPLSSIPSMPSYNLRSFAKKPSTMGPSQTTARLMVHMLTSFPLAMRNEDSLPPFIHPSYFSRNEESDHKQFEALSCCMSLMQIVTKNAPGSRKLLWKNVRLECERLQDEVRILHLFQR